MRYGLVCLILLSSASCSRLGFLHLGKKHEPEARTEMAAPEAETPMPANDAPRDNEAELRRIVRRTIEAAENMTDQQRHRVIARKPYFLKEYMVYPDGPDEMEVILQETELRTAPLLADVVVAKKRFTTKLHRKRQEARADSSFLRDTGVEKVTFEMRNGRWTRIGAVFLSDKTEEMVNGEWVPVEEEIQRTIAKEEEQSEGWLRRKWTAITGR